MSKKLTQAALKKACSRHNWALQWCWNYEKMQAAGYAYAMVPIIKELYDGKCFEFDLCESEIKPCFDFKNFEVSTKTTFIRKIGLGEND